MGGLQKYLGDQLLGHRWCHVKRLHAASVRRRHVRERDRDRVKRGGIDPATSEPLGRVLPAAPVDTTAPGISGTAQQGDTLTGAPGFWNNSPTGYRYGWQDCIGRGTGCAAIAGATSSTYTLHASDVGMTSA